MDVVVPRAIIEMPVGSDSPPFGEVSQNRAGAEPILETGPQRAIPPLLTGGHKANARAVPLRCAGDSGRWRERRDAGDAPLTTQRVRVLIKPHGMCRWSVLLSNAWVSCERINQLRAK